MYATRTRSRNPVVGTRFTCYSALLGIAFALIAPGLRAEEPTTGDAFEKLLPRDAVAYVRLTGLGEKVDAFLESDLRDWIVNHPAYAFVKAQDGVQEGLRNIEEARKRIGIAPKRLFSDLLGRDVAASVSLGFVNRVVLLSRVASRESFAEILAKVRAAVSEQAGSAFAGARSEHRGSEVEDFGEFAFALVDDILVVASSANLVRDVIDRHAGTNSESLANTPELARIGSARRTDIRLVLRPSYLPLEGMSGRHDDAMASLLFGGFAKALQHSDLLTVGLDLRADGVVLRSTTYLREGSSVSKPSAWFPKSKPAPELAAIGRANGLAAVRIDRDIGAWWAMGEEILQARALRKLTEFSQGMAFIFGGRNFEDDVLPQIASPMMFVSELQDFSGIDVKPEPALPGFALLVPLADAATFGPTLVSSFQSVVGFIRTTQGQNRQDGSWLDMLLATESVGDAQVHHVTLSTTDPAKKGLLANFTPSMTVAGRWFVLSSTRQLAVRLAKQLTGDGKPSSTRTGRGGARGSTGDFLAIDGAGVRRALEANYSLLVSKSMLEKGISKEEAEGEIDVLLSLFEAVDGFRLRGLRRGGQLELRAKLGLSKSPVGRSSAPASPSTAAARF